jgi:hypothetical protein
MGVVGKVVEEVVHAFVDVAVARQRSAPRFQFIVAWEMAVDEQVAHGGEFEPRRQLLDGVATVTEDAFLTIDECDGAFAGASIAVTRIEGDGAGLLAQGRDVDPHLVFGAHHHGVLVFFPVQN